MLMDIKQRLGCTLCHVKGKALTHVCCRAVLGQIYLYWPDDKKWYRAHFEKVRDNALISKHATTWHTYSTLPKR